MLDRGDVDGKPANSHSSAASLGRLDNGFRVGDLEHHLMRTAFAGDAPPRPHLGDDELGSRFARESKLRSMPLSDARVG